MITIFTPAYNRAGLLNRLYSSLLKQTNNDFEWIIVDDGSTDETKQVVSEMIKENILRINYKYQANGGKHVAFNSGVDLAAGELFFCVDSDDYLPDDAVEKIINVTSALQNKETIGLIALKSYINGEIIDSSFNIDIQYSTISELSSLMHIGEKTIIYKTDLLKNNKFPVIEGEKFMGECVLYDKLDKFGKLFILDEVLTVCEYQEDGLTGNLNKIMKENPAGYCLYYMQRIDIQKSFLKQLLISGKYNCFAIFAKDKKSKYMGKHKLLVRFSVLLGWLFLIYYKIWRDF